MKAWACWGKQQNTISHKKKVISIAVCHLLYLLVAIREKNLGCCSGRCLECGDSEIRGVTMQLNSAFSVRILLLRWALAISTLMASKDAFDGTQLHSMEMSHVSNAYVVAPSNTPQPQYSQHFPSVLPIHMHWVSAHDLRQGRTFRYKRGRKHRNSWQQAGRTNRREPSNMAVAQWQAKTTWEIPHGCIINALVHEKNTAQRLETKHRKRRWKSEPQETSYWAIYIHVQLTAFFQDRLWEFPLEKCFAPRKSSLMNQVLTENASHSS